VEDLQMRYFIALLFALAWLPVMAQTPVIDDHPSVILGTIDEFDIFHRNPDLGPLDPVDSQTDEVAPQPGTAHYYNVDGSVNGWTDTSGALADTHTQRWLTENLVGYEPLTWVDVIGQDVYFSRAGDDQRAHLAWIQAPSTVEPVYRMVNGSWVDHDYKSVGPSIATSLTRSVPVGDVSGWHSLSGRAFIWTEHGGYGPGPADTRRTYDYARPAGAPNDPHLSTGWLGPKGTRDIHVQDYNRRTPSGELIHVHGHYRSEHDSKKSSGKSSSGKRSSSSHRSGKPGGRRK
jgi:hypothetical protein